MNEYSDKELLLLFHDMESRSYAFNLIVRKYQQRLYWHIRKIVIIHDDADDVLQNTFIKVWKGLENFREESQLYSWLYRIATNEAITFLNQKKKRYFLSIDEELKDHLVENLLGDEYFSEDEAQLKLQKAILELPEKQRLVFNMRYFDEMKYEEISEILDTSVGSLKASYHHAAKKIEKYLTDN